MEYTPQALRPEVYINWSRTYVLDQYALQALRPEVQKENYYTWTRTKSWSTYCISGRRPEMQYTIHTFSFGKRKSVAKRKSTWNLGRKAQIPLLPFGQNNRKKFLRGVQLPVHFMVVHHEICSKNHFGVFSATFHCSFTVRSQLLDSTPMHPKLNSFSLLLPYHHNNTRKLK